MGFELRLVGVGEDGFEEVGDGVLMEVSGEVSDVEFFVGVGLVGTGWAGVLGWWDLGFEDVTVAFVGLEDLFWGFGVVVGVGECVEVEGGGVVCNCLRGGFEDLDGAVGVGGVEFKKGTVDEGFGLVGVEGLDLLECGACVVVVSEFGLSGAESCEGAGVVGLDRECFGVEVEGLLVFLAQRVE